MIGAHVTLFHALPGGEVDAILADLVDVACAQKPFDVLVTEVISLGRGAAYRLRSQELAAVHAEMATRWRGWLTPQDRQPFRPHVTVQNKADPQMVAATLAALRAGFVPFSVRGLGLSVWRYVGGPWSPVVTVPFSAGAPGEVADAVGRGG